MSSRNHIARWDGSLDSNAAHVTLEAGPPHWAVYLPVVVKQGGP